MKNIKNIEKKWIKNFGILKFIFPNIASIFLFITIFFLSFFIINKLYSEKILQLNNIPVFFNISKNYSFYNQIILDGEIEKEINRFNNTADYYNKKLFDNKIISNKEFFNNNLLLLGENYHDFLVNNSSFQISQSHYDDLIQIANKKLSLDSNCDKMIAQLQISNAKSFKFDLNANYKGSTEVEAILENDVVIKNAITQIKSKIDLCEMIIQTTIENRFKELFTGVLRGKINLYNFETKKITETINNLKKDKYSDPTINDKLEILEFKKNDIANNLMLFNKILVQYENNDLKKIKMNIVNSLILEDYKIGKSLYYNKNMLIIIISVMISVTLILLIDLILKINSNKKRIYFD
jgi:hypothetical protein